VAQSLVAKPCCFNNLFIFSFSFLRVRIDHRMSHRFLAHQARRIALNIARLPELLGKAERD
jgi:hypothetical protein